MFESAGTILFVLCSMTADSRAAGAARLESETASGSETTARRAITLEQAVRIALEMAPGIAAARGRVLKAEGVASGAVLPPDPEVVVTRGRGRPGDGAASAAESGMDVRQILPAPWGLAARRRSATASVRAARDELDAAAVQVVFDVKRLFYEAAVGEGLASVLGEAARDAALLRDLMARRVQVGEAPEADRLRTEVEALGTELEARAAKAEAEAARAVLDQFLLGALGADFTLAADLDPARLAPPPERALDAVLTRNPAYRAAAATVEARRSAVSAERASRAPGLSLSLFREREFDREAWGAGLGLAVPLWNRNRGPLAVSRGELVEAEADARRLRAEIGAEFERVLRRYEVARDVAVTYQQRILPASREALSISRVSLEQGESSLLSWLEARRSYLETVRASYRALLEAFLARAELDRLMGETDGLDER